MDYPNGDIFTLIDVLYLIPFAKLVEFLSRNLTVKIIGFTLGGRFYFRSRDEYLKILNDLGFKVNSIKLDSGYLYPHILYLCKK
jgi:transposase